MQISWKRTPLALSAITLALSAQMAYAADTATAAIDPATGKLRPIEHDDKTISDAAAKRQAFGAAAKPQSPALQRMAQGAGQVRYHSNGAMSLRNNLEQMDFTVATRNADGSISTQCVQGEDAATHALHAHGKPQAKGGADAQ
jgi:hypothetical protein